MNQMPTSLSREQVSRLRQRSQRLLRLDPGAPEMPADILGRVFCVQAQDLPAARLSLRARGSGFTDALVDAARQEERSIVWTSSLRGTLHLTTRADARWLVPTLAPGMIAGDRRRMEQLGWDEESTRQGLVLLRKALQERGPLTRTEIARLLRDQGLPSEGQAVPHLIFRAAYETILCLGPDHGKEHTYILFTDWLGAPETLPEQDALARLARRYLQAYAPASPQDFAAWSGLKNGQARQAFALLEAERVEVDAAGDRLSLLQDQLPWLDERQADAPVLRLLPRFDTYLLGYRDRSLMIPPQYASRVNRGGGMIAATVLLDGRVIGNWSLQKKKNRLEITVQPFEPLPTSLRPMLESETEDIGRFLGRDVIMGD